MACGRGLGLVAARVGIQADPEVGLGDLGRKSGAKANDLGRLDDVGGLAALEDQHARRVVVGDRYVN
jgi:hypothetical protein